MTEPPDKDALDRLIADHFYAPVEPRADTPVLTLFTNDDDYTILPKRRRPVLRVFKGGRAGIAAAILIPWRTIRMHPAGFITSGLAAGAGALMVIGLAISHPDHVANMPHFSTPPQAAPPTLAPGLKIPRFGPVTPKPQPSPVASRGPVTQGPAAVTSSPLPSSSPSPVPSPSSSPRGEKCTITLLGLICVRL